MTGGPELVGAQVVDWLRDFLEDQGGQCLSREAVAAVAQRGVHERTLRRAAGILESGGIMKRTHHGVRRERHVTWTLTADAAAQAIVDRCPAPDDTQEPVVQRPVLMPQFSDACTTCHHTAPHTARGIRCPACPRGACTPREQSHG